MIKTTSHPLGTRTEVDGADYDKVVKVASRLSFHRGATTRVIAPLSERDRHAAYTVTMGGHTFCLHPHYVSTITGETDPFAVIYSQRGV